MSSKFLCNYNIVLYELKKPRYTIIDIWNFLHEPYPKTKDLSELKISTDMK